MWQVANAGALPQSRRPKIAHHSHIGVVMVVVAAAKAALLLLCCRLLACGFFFTILALCSRVYTSMSRSYELLGNPRRGYARAS